jgi:hypothetical protein
MKPAFVLVLVAGLAASPLTAQPARQQNRPDANAQAAARGQTAACGIAIDEEGLYRTRGPRGTASGIAIDEEGLHRTQGPRGTAAGIAIDEEGLFLHRPADRRRVSAAMTSVATRSRMTIDAARLEIVSTAEGTLAIAPTTAAVSGRIAAGDPVMLIWASIPNAGGRAVNGFFQVASFFEGWPNIAASTCPRLPGSLQREVHWRLRDGGTGSANARFVYRPLPSMPPPVLTPMDVEDPPLNWPR